MSGRGAGSAGEGRAERERPGGAAAAADGGPADRGPADGGISRAGPQEHLAPGGRLAPTAAPIHELIALRWSPRAFDARPVDAARLSSLFEAARWAPSCNNEQPWRFLLATQADPEWIERLRGYLNRGNAWARKAPVLVASAFTTTFARSGGANRLAPRDLGAAEQNLVLEAYHQGLVAHQMAGFDDARLAEELLPEGVEPGSMIALGWPGDPAQLPDERRRDRLPRERRPVAEFVYGAEWERPSGVLG